ncbi:MAG: TIGR02099 family protein, partial [Proteobacteria bacterium]|nr:TIGR02099 family protein [Pseudomonadota bacterium]
RVLGLASLAALPRRLTLDFSDLTDKGLAYDLIRGSFDLHEGNAYTSNLLLEGPALEIGLIGRVGLAKRDLDQTAVVAGNFGVTLPIASTLAAGPVVGAAVLVFSQLFKQPLKGLVRGYYRITGSWENPQIERVKSDAAAEAQRESQAVHK